MENSRVPANLSESALRNVYTLLPQSSFSLPYSVTSLFENYIGDGNGDNHSTARSGCNDPFSIFGFLAFLLVLLQLLANNQGGRRKRSIEDCSTHQESKEVMEGMLAVHLIFQGFVNSLGEGRKC